MNHIWKQRTANWIQLDSKHHALVRIKPMPDGKFLWQFRKVISFADTVDKAKDYVEAGAEFFDVMHRNPYAT